MFLCCFMLFFYFLILDMLNLFWFMNFTLFMILKLYQNFYDGMFYTDFLSLSLMFISFWIFIISTLCNNQSTSGMLIIWMMMIFITLSFFIFNGFLFYLFFEFSFTLMFLFLLSWGLMMERLQASLYMLFYTLVFSLPLLILIIESTMISSMNYYLLYIFSPQDFLWMFMILVFIVKLPLFNFHLWLPKAHVEAPTPGSMILAGVLLKLGGYGLIRFFNIIEFISIKNNLFVTYLFLMSIVGGLFMNFVCMRQTDLKMFIAYSSIVHMSMVFLSIFSYSFTAQLGCILMMVAHGFVSPSLFFLMSLIYKNSFSRSIYSLKGAFSLFPIFSLLWLISCSLNFGFPPFMSFFSEVFIISSLSFLPLTLLSLLILFLFLSGTYSIYLYITVTHGNPIFHNSFKIPNSELVLNFPLIFFVLNFPLIFFVF